MDIHICLVTLSVYQGANMLHDLANMSVGGRLLLPDQ